MQNNTDHNITKYASIQALPLQDRELMEKAIESANRAYAPYSHYRVGAALRLDTGMVISGNNQENMAYPSGLCAERVALFSAAANYPHASIKSIAIRALDADGKIASVSPCGACRQVMAEYENLHKKPIRVIFQYAENEIIVAKTIESLLPYGFKLNPADRK